MPYFVRLLCANFTVQFSIYNDSTTIESVVCRWHTVATLATTASLLIHLVKWCASNLNIRSLNEWNYLNGQ